ncbi:MAG: hypothetical protein ACK5U4_16270, partial [Rhodospirillales bacterium]
MAIISNSGTKTLGHRSAQLITELNERRRQTFGIADVCDITNLPAAQARSLVHKAKQRGLVTRLKPGLFSLVPFEHGKSTEFVDSPYLIARELLAGGRYYLSHGTALELHRMVTQPNHTIFVSCTKRVRIQKAGGYEFRFVHVRETDLFGFEKIRIDEDRGAMVSDLERTILDGLRNPEFAGGISEVAKGIWMKRQDIDVEKLVEYARRLDVGAVVRRLGFLLER